MQTFPPARCTQTSSNRHELLPTQGRRQSVHERAPSLTLWHRPVPPHTPFAQANWQAKREVPGTGRQVSSALHSPPGVSEEAVQG